MGIFTQLSYLHNSEKEMKIILKILNIKKAQGPHDNCPHDACPQALCWSGLRV